MGEKKENVVPWGAWQVCGLRGGGGGVRGVPPATQHVPTGCTGWRAEWMALIQVWERKRRRVGLVTVTSREHAREGH